MHDWHLNDNILHDSMLCFKYSLMGIPKVHSTMVVVYVTKQLNQMSLTF